MKFFLKNDEWVLLIELGTIIEIALRAICVKRILLLFMRDHKVKPQTNDVIDFISFYDRSLL